MDLNVHRKKWIRIDMDTVVLGKMIGRRKVANDQNECILFIAIMNNDDSNWKEQLIRQTFSMIPSLTSLVMAVMGDVAPGCPVWRLGTLWCNSPFKQICGQESDAMQSCTCSPALHHAELTHPSLRLHNANRNFWTPLLSSFAVPTSAIYSTSW